MDTSDSLINFDDKGVCDHCRNYYDNILPDWQHGKHGAQKLEKLLGEIKRHGKDKPYDCMMGLSGGLDSSYLAYAAVKLWGLRPKFINIDTHWNMPVADENIRKLVKGLDIELETIVVDWEELKDLQVAYFKSQVPYQDNPQDLAIFAASYNYAAKNNVRYFLNGGNHSNECIREPVEWTHINDMAQLRDIHRQFGKNPLVKYPTLGFFKKNLYYRFCKDMRIIKALDLIPYNKQEAIELLGREFDWKPYQHKHYENRFTRFYEGYWIYHKFGWDKRRAYYSSLIVTEQMSRGDVLEMLESPPYDETLAMEDLKYIANRLGITKDEFIALMKQPNKTWENYKSDKAMITFAIKTAKLFGMERRNYR
jgi:N-acetyl sugar amidotransferase